MTEFRRDPIIGQWVLVHTDDSLRPDDFKKEDQTSKNPQLCQFCPGKEHFTPSEIESIRDPGTTPNKEGWHVRIVPNKFPALRIEGNLDYRQIDLLEISNGIGAHEVLIENPDHFKQLPDLSAEEVFNVVRKYHSRFLDLSKDNRFKYIIIFKNFGESAGATVEHAHSQIIALPMVPEYVHHEIEGAKEYFNEHKRCVYCDIIEQENKEKERIVAENEDFIVFCPFVPRYAFECWIMPKKHNADFAAISERQQYSLAQILKETLLRIKNCLSNPSYNYYLHLAPVNDGHQESFHWHIEIVPKLTNVTGFEWGTGFFVVKTSPFVAAQYLRKVSV